MPGNICMSQAENHAPRFKTVNDQPLNSDLWCQYQTEDNKLRPSISSTTIFCSC